MAYRQTPGRGPTAAFKNVTKLIGPTAMTEGGEVDPNTGVKKAKLEKTARQIVAGGTYDADAVKANKEQRTKEFNATPEGSKMAKQMQILSGAMGTQKGQTSGPNKGKFTYEDLSKDPGYQTVYFTKDDYKNVADKYAKAKFEFSRPINEAMKEKLGNIKTYTDTETGKVQDYGEFYGNAGGDRFANIGKAKIEVNRPNKK
jgi:hypothetical protein